MLVADEQVQCCGSDAEEPLEAVEEFPGLSSLGFRYFVTSLLHYFSFLRRSLWPSSALSQSSSPTPSVAANKVKSSPGFTRPVSRSSPSSPCASPKRNPAAP